jgi:hypothetical protein
MGKASVRIAHFLISIIAGVLMGYAFYSFRHDKTIWESAGAGLIAFLMGMILLPKLHRGGGGGGGE